jgi:hypothetical protein
MRSKPQSARGTYLCRHARYLAGEELTPDWAVTNDEAYLVEYNCGAPDCQKSLIGKDQRRLDLQKRYSGYFSGYLAQNRSFGDAALGAAHKQF